MTDQDAAPEPLPTACETYPFWGYSDLFLFIGFALPSLLVGALLVRGVMALVDFQPDGKAWVLLPAQFVGYAILFGLLWMLFRFHHHRPFWKSLRWEPPRLKWSSIVLAGVVLALAVAATSIVLRTPDIESPMKELLEDPSSVLMVAIFGTTLAPLFEELAFRGFMQPLFVKSFGAVAGILLAALPFGLLHLQQYGFSWRHGLLITLAGAGFGWMRHSTGSTQAAVIMHAAYNGTFVLALLAQRKEMPHPW